MGAFLTNPDNPQVAPQLKGDFDFKEALEKELVVLGIPYYYARCVSVDMKPLWIPCFKKGLTPKRTAKFLLADIKKAYKLIDNQTKLA